MTGYAGLRGGVAGIALLLAATGVEAAPETVAGLAAHRAVYEISLARRADRSDVVDVGGRLVYEFSGNRCDGFSSRFRLVTRAVDADGGARLTDVRTTSFEDANGKSYDFVNQNLVDNRTVEDVKGKARHDGGETKVTIATPTAATYDLPATARFPTEHLVEIIEAAKAGKRIAEIDLFDGSEGGSRIYRTTVVIGPEASGTDDLDQETAAAGIPGQPKGLRRWPIDISYFDPAKAASDATPDYQLGFLLYENGVSRRLRLDYGDFVMAGRLTSFESLPAGTCK